MPAALDMLHVPACPANAAAVELAGILVIAAHVVSAEPIDGDRVRQLLKEYGYTDGAIAARMADMEETGPDVLLELTGDRLLLVAHSLEQVRSALGLDVVMVGDSAPKKSKG